MFEVVCLGFTDECFVFTVCDVGCRVKGTRLRVHGLRRRVIDSGFRV